MALVPVVKINLPTEILLLAKMLASYLRPNN